MDTIYSTRMGGNTSDLLQAYKPQSNPMVGRPAASSTPSSQDVMDWANKWFGSQKQQDPGAIARGNEALATPDADYYKTGADLQNEQQMTAPGGEFGPGTNKANIMSMMPGGISPYAANQIMGNAPSQPAPQADLAGMANQLQSDVNAAANPPVDTGMDMAPNDWKYEKMPADPTNNQKHYTPAHVEAGKQGVNLAMSANQPTNPMQAATQAQDQQKLHQDLTDIAAAKDPKKAWQDKKKDPFYKDSAFYSGVMATGLAIMSGANPLQAFQAGQGQMEKQDVQNQLSDNREALMQMYTPDSVAAAIASGDQTKLKQKKMTDEERLNAENKMWQQHADYSNAINQQNTQAANQEWTRRNAITSQQEDLRQQQQQAMADRRSDLAFERQKEMLGLKGTQTVQTFKDKAEAKAEIDKQQAEAGGWQPSRSQLSNEKAQWATIGSKFSSRAINFGSAENAIQKGMATQDTTEAAANFKIALEQATQALVGGQRSISKQDLDEMAGNPNFIQRKGNEYVMAAGFKPTQKSWDYLNKLVQADKQATLGPLHDRMMDRMHQLVAGGYTPKQAQIQINQGSNLGVMISNDDVDTYTKRQASARQGALSGGADMGGITF